MKTYLIVSETIYHMSEKLKELTSGIDNIISFNMEVNDINEILEEANYFSLFSEEKCIIVRNAKIFYDKKDEDSDKLLKYLENENPYVKLIFIANSKVDTRRKIYTTLKNNNNVFSYHVMNKTDMKNELLNYVKNNGYKISTDSIWYIINNSPNFDICINELNKIFIYLGKEKEISQTVVQKLVCKSIEDNNFKFVDAVINKDLNTSLKLLDDLVTLKVEPSVMLALLYREFSLMYKSYLLERKRMPNSDILKELNLQSWQYDNVKNNMRKYNINEIKENIIKLQDYDYKYKSGIINRDVILINYIIDVCS